MVQGRPTTLACESLQVEGSIARTDRRAVSQIENALEVNDEGPEAVQRKRPVLRAGVLRAEDAGRGVRGRPERKPPTIRNCGRSSGTATGREPMRGPCWRRPTHHTRSRPATISSPARLVEAGARNAPPPGTAANRTDLTVAITILLRAFAAPE